MHTKELEQFDFQLQTSKQSILNLTDEITSRKKRNDSLIYKKEVELNQKINEISAKYAEIRKLNEIQSKIELDALKNSINIITEKYNNIKQNLSLELQDLFQVIDDDIDKITLKYNAKMEQFYQEQALERF